MITNDAYLLSINPNSAQAILDGRKDYEFRRRFSPYSRNMKFFLYVVSPVKKIVAECFFDSPIEFHLDEVEKFLKSNFFDTKESLLNYLNGCERAYALPLISFKEFRNPVSLNELRTVRPGFNPPVSFVKLYKEKDFDILGILESRKDDTPNEA